MRKLRIDSATVAATIVLLATATAAATVSACDGGRTWPFASLILMAGLQTVPRDLYEASSIGGAGIWQQIGHITMPALRQVDQVLVPVLFRWTFNDFNVPYILFGESAPSAGLTAGAVK